MRTEIETFTGLEPSFRTAGEWVVAESSKQNLARIDIPAFVIWADQVFKKLESTGVGNELPPALVNWLGVQMRDTERHDFTQMHPAFSKLFPIPKLPDTVTPEWKPWKIIETTDPATKIVVQPLTFHTVTVPNLMASRRMDAVPFVRRIDPFVMAEVGTLGQDGGISRGEAGHLRVIATSFWNNVATANEREQKALQAVQVISPREAAESTRLVMDEASVALFDLAQKVSLYVRSLDVPGHKFPLTPTARGVIQIPWILKAAEAWLSPIKTLAAKGRVELPLV